MAGWIRVDQELDTDPDLVGVGFDALHVYVTLARIAARVAEGGFIPERFARPAYVAGRAGETGQKRTEAALNDLRQRHAIVPEAGGLRVVNMDHFKADPTAAERMKAYRERKTAKTQESSDASYRNDRNVTMLRQRDVRDVRNGTDDQSPSETPPDPPAAAPEEPDDAVAKVVLELFPAARKQRGWDGWAAAQRDACPGVNLEVEVRKAAAWQASNPSKAKRDVKRFLGSWLARAQDKTGGLPLAPAAPVRPAWRDTPYDPTGRSQAGWGRGGDRE